MGRMKERDFKILKERSNDVTPCFFAKEAVRGLVAHAEAIELELKISKEDEEEAVRRFGEAELSIVRLNQKVDHLNRELGESRADELLATQSADRLSTENDTLKAQLEAKKVVLPKEVAEAIEDYRSGGHDTDYIIRALASRSGGMPLPRLQTLLDYAADHGHQLIDALVNDFTVEEPLTTEDKLEAKFEQLLEKNNIGRVVPVRELAILLTLVVRGVLAEDRQEE
ncbi:hypothetical protein [Bacillus sp. FJAT-26390]|uniref:hypothetical protein n=1 Tax=Bacillus sp. FJAT-26390 TaxID=1743142 RepID=UPI000807ED41|nr:hypothetical protein [Bacillus sp. FJAT-26390]OBZ08016.1 hypothetical protein A7975_27185 [Bacillus sp. FJAT-26390]